MKMRLNYLPCLPARQVQKNSILKSFLVYFLFSGFIYSVYATNWYIDRDAPGPIHNGTSWATAWTSFDTYWTANPNGADWTVMSGGDTVYVSGGNDSTVYRGTQYIRGPADGTAMYFSPEVVVCPSWESGHNGDVYFVNADSTKRCFSISYISGLKLTGFHFVREVPAIWNYLGKGEILLSIEDDSLVTIQNCTFTGTPMGNYINPWATKVTIDHCTITIPANDWWNPQDPIGGGFGECRGGFTITNNTIIWHCYSESNHPDHRDLIQLNQFGSDANLLTTIANNIMIMDAPYATGINSGIYSTTRHGDNRFLIYNNIIVTNSYLRHNPFIDFQNDDVGSTSSIRILNNTVITKNAASAYLVDCDTLEMKNNIFQIDSATNYQLIIGRNDTQFNSIVKEIDYNHYDQRDGHWQDPFVSVSAGSDWDWGTEWQPVGLDIHSDTGHVTYTNKFDTLATGYYTTTGRDSGVDLSSIDIPTYSYTGTVMPPITEDILGNSRSGSWDMGALEYQGGGGNIPPNQPQNPSPANGSIDQPINTTLSWTCLDPNGDPLTYDVYFGTTSNPQLVVNSQSNTSYNPGQLNYNTPYYWKIVAKDNQGSSTAGPLWSFSTIASGGSGGDITPPEVISAQLSDSVHLQIVFSEPLEQTSAQNTGNYAIDNNINVLGASLSDSVVTLTTTPHSSGFYTVTVINVKDLAGNPIAPPNNTATYEYAVITSTVTASIKVFLDGPYTDDAMSTDLSANSLVPSAQPYNQQPWNYTGSENVSTVPQDIVDWILVELRSGTSATTVVARRAAFLRNDGIVVDLNGQPKVRFSNVQNGQYYIVIRHRNHLAIMTKDPVPLNDSSSLYDFTLSEDKAYGSQPMKYLGNDKYGLYAADGNANGNVNSSDYVGVWKKQNGTLGYKPGDFDLNGGVNITDRNAKWNPNKGKSSQVP